MLLIEIAHLWLVILEQPCAPIRPRVLLAPHALHTAHCLSIGQLGDGLMAPACQHLLTELACGGVMVLLLVGQVAARLVMVLN